MPPTSQRTPTPEHPPLGNDSGRPDGERISRRIFFTRAIPVAGAALVMSGVPGRVIDFLAGDSEPAIDYANAVPINYGNQEALEPVILDSSDIVKPPEYIDPTSKEELFNRAGELRQHDPKSLAKYLLGSSEISYDVAPYGRVQKSMEWAAALGRLPVVDIHPDEQLSDPTTLDPKTIATETVAVAHDLLVVLAILRDAGVSYQINSLATSDAHTVTSNHYWGNGVDLATNSLTPEQQETILRILNLLDEGHDSGTSIIPFEEIFGTSQFAEHNRKNGRPTSKTESDHLHFAVVDTNQRYLEGDPRFTQLFANQTAQVAVQELGLDHSSYFNVSTAKGNELAQNGFGFSTANQINVNGLYSDNVSQHDAGMTAASIKYNVPKEFIMTITTMESGGRPDAASEASAFGVMQMVASKHRTRIDAAMGIQLDNSPESDSARQQYLLDNPDTAIDLGTQYLSELLQDARAFRPELHPDHPTIYALAAAGYHSGWHGVTTNLEKGDFADIGKRAQIYFNTTVAYYVDVAIAKKMIASGVVAPQDIHSAMKTSVATWARFEALQQLDNFVSNPDYETGMNKGYRMAEPLFPGTTDNNVSGELSDQNAHYYRDLVHGALAGYYDNKGNQSLPKPTTTPLTPSQSFYFVHGGRGFYNIDQ